MEIIRQMTMTNVIGSTFSGVAHPRPSKSFLHIDKSYRSSPQIMLTFKTSTALDYDTQCSQFSHTTGYITLPTLDTLTNLANSNNTG